MTPRRVLVAALRRVAPGTAARATAEVRRRRALTGLLSEDDGIRAAHRELGAAHADLVAAHAALGTEVEALRAELEATRVRAGAADDAIARLTDGAGTDRERLDEAITGLVEQRALSLRIGQLTDLVFAELASAVPSAAGRQQNDGGVAERT